ncbi:MAG: extracellular solute-binding protein [Deferribacteres bacterium]|nr:extracellular solute-binding protein [candidate division KSB1 bacterium]MCB9504311.1 extracellular solute-binding protein [Deferribacteres bacterium]
MKKLLTGTNLFLASLLTTCIALVAYFFPPAGNELENEPDQLVKIYYADNISPAHREIIDAFNAEHAGKIEVVTIDLPFSKFSTNERKELLARALRSKSSRLDVFAVDLIWVPRFARWAEPLDEFLETNLQIDFLNYALQSCYFEDKLVALPLYLDIGLMYYQQDVLQSQFPNWKGLEPKLKKSITWEELIKMGINREKKDDNFYLFPGDNFEGLVCTFMELVLSQDPKFFEHSPVQLNAPESRKALQLLVDLVHTYHLTPEKITDYDGYKVDQHALRNNGVFWRSWPGLAVQVQHSQALQARLKFLRIGAIPHFEGSKPVSVFGGWNLMVSRHSENKKEAMQFIKYLLQRESQLALYKKGGYLPILKNIYMDKELVGKNSELSYYHELLKKGIHRPYRVDYTKWSDVISYYAHQALKKEMTVEQALQTATERINSKKVLVR